MTIAVYCSAKNTIPEEYKQLGEALGQWLAQAGHSLLYGGATGGLMTCVSDSFGATDKTAEQKIIGVIPQRIIAAGRMAPHCDELIEVSDMADRKRTMRQMADCFIVLPGSYGTLDELYDVVASGTVGEHHKPLYIINYKGYYNPLIALANQMRALSFLPEQEMYSPIYVNSLVELQHVLTTK